MNDNSLLIEKISLLPLAITQSDETKACVGAITSTGKWIRPEPIKLPMVNDHSCSIQYDHWLTYHLKLSEESDRRPEDRHLIRIDLKDKTQISNSESYQLITSILDKNVETGFSDSRSLGIIRADIEDIYIKKSTGGRNFIRLIFIDNNKNEYDWIVPELRFRNLINLYTHENQILEPAKKMLLEKFKKVKIFLTIGLTKPNNRFPGQFNGCHPLVVGIHTFPSII